jgi:acyl transferase domain-containing protein
VAHRASIVAVSARSPGALRKLAAAYEELVAQRPDVGLEDFAFSVNTGRMHFEHRAVLLASDREELLAKLGALSSSGGIEESSSASARGLDGSPSRQLLEELARQYLDGRDVDWAALYRGYPGQRLALPHYPFERRRYWLDSQVDLHPLLGRRLPPQAHLSDTWTWQSRLESAATEFLSGHRLMGSPVLPYSAYVDMALCAVSQARHSNTAAISDLILHEPLFLRAEDPQRLQTVLSVKTDGQLSFAVYHQSARPGHDAAWRLCASANLRSSANEA